MVEKKAIKSTKRQRVTVSKNKLAATANDIEDAAIAAAISGEQEAIQGANKLKEAAQIGAVGTDFIAQGASDLTRAAYERIMSERMAVLSEVVATAGVVDVAEGAEMLAASEDVGVVSALVGMMSLGDLEHGMELARLSGELYTAGEIIEALKMPVLSLFLGNRAARLHEMSVEQIRIAMSTDGISKALAATGQKINALGQNEVEEGILRMSTSEAVSVESARLSEASDELAVQGITELVIGNEVRETAKLTAVEGASEISSGAAVMGAALAMDEIAETLKEKSK
ncbi:MAG: hypothetical protein C3F13_19565 [Anaerolineales bacterium]|nr:hypothetical protein [Anaerolineae bacterium]PWB49594.1 MAG: hypothetical protein C3F13_19565 [Anaerolineales bacterium]